MLVVYGGAVGQASGRLGADVASKNRYGSYWRKGTAPITSTTPRALQAKARFAECSQAWQLLTAAQMEAWKQWAQTNPVLNRLGQTVTLTGHAAYIGMNTRLVRLSIPKIDDPPVIPAPAPLLTLSFNADIGAGDVEAVFAPTPTGASEGLSVWGCVTESAGINYIGNLLRHMTYTAAAQTTPFNLEAQFAAQFGTLQVGQIAHVACGIIDRDNGQVSGLHRAKATVVSTV